MNEEKLKLKILDSIRLDDQNAQLLSNENPYEIFFKNERYSLAIFQIKKTGAENHNQEARRVQIKHKYKETFLKKSSEGICAIIIGYHLETDTFTTWEIFRNIYSDNKNWNTSKSLYTNINILNSAMRLGSAITPPNTNYVDDSAAITFKSNYLSNYLIKPDLRIIRHNNNEEEILTLDYLHNRKNSDDFCLKIQNLESGVFPNIKNKINRSNNWILEEYIVVFNLYIQIKLGESNNNQNNNEFKKTFEILKLISQKNKSTERTLDSISRRVANYKSKDPEWDGGLDGADKNPFVIFVVKKYLHNRLLLLKDLKKIIEKYSQKENINNYRIYNREINNLDGDFSLSSENIYDQLEIQNLIDKKKKIHEKIVNILANKLKKKISSI